MRLLLTTGLVLALAACGASEEPAGNVATPTPTPGPSLGGVALDKPLRAGGESPYWEIYIAPGTIAYADAPDAAPTDFYPIMPVVRGRTASYSTRTPEREPVTITLSAQPCALGSGSLPLTVEARIGARSFKGCAGPVERRRVTPLPNGANASAGS